MFSQVLERLLQGRSLTMEEAREVMGLVMEGRLSPVEVSALLVALRAKGETAEEIAGMALAMREKALKVPVEGPLVDTCGTGGDGKGTFNVSTAVAFVVAGAGVRVAKHGNRSASSRCGSADVLEALGVRIALSPQGVAECIRTAGVGFMFAPVFHPAMRHAMPVRRELGVRTVFNILGPLTNPAGAGAQLLGVASADLGEKMARVLSLLGVERAFVVHGEEGLDEVSPAGPTRLWRVAYGQTEALTVAPEDLGVSRFPLERVRGGSARENADLMRRVLSGEKGPLQEFVVLNSAPALVVAGVAQDLQEGAEKARRVLDSGEALRRLETLVEVSQRLE